jgi:hypothetical protein
LILELFTSYGYAQMAGQKAEGEMQKGQMMQQKGMMGHKEMMENMTGMINQMSGMMGKMPDIGYGFRRGYEEYAG